SIARFFAENFGSNFGGNISIPLGESLINIDNSDTTDFLSSQ
ncbi:1239_t:CDS:1, partial [Funneliformis caledonium]